MLHPCVSGMSEACRLNVRASKCLPLVSAYLFVLKMFCSRGRSVITFTLLSELYAIFFSSGKKLKTFFGAELTWSAEFPVMGAALP